MGFGKWLIKIAIFAALWFVGIWLFSGFGGSIGTYGSALYIGNYILGSSITADGSNIVTLIFSFIITVGVYYLIAEILTFIVTKLFGMD